MKQEGPLLAALTHRLSECPDDFVDVGEQDDGGLCVAALISDFFRRYGDGNPIVAGDPFLRTLVSEHQGRAAIRHAGLLSVSLWLFYDAWFSDKPQFSTPIWDLLRSNGFRSVAQLLQAKQAIADPDRREELVRICLNGLELRPQGESIAQATDRLMTLNSVERERILRETAAAEKRAREVREAMARVKAMESVSRYGE
jgi:hypothetical protein